MFRFVAVAWNESSPSHTEVAERMSRRMLSAPGAWEEVFNQSGIRVYCADERPGSSECYWLHDNRGIVLGTVFEKVDEAHSVARKARFAATPTMEIMRTHGRRLVENYWGRYVAFLVDAADETLLTIRSPSGELDCLTCVREGVRLYFSDLHDCPPMDGARLSVNWDYVASEIATLLPDTRVTGFKKVERVLRGECVAIGPDYVKHTQYWHPFDFVARECRDAPQAAARRLRNLTRACIHAWASCYDSIVPMLSGGLDSSVLVNMLRDAPSHPAATCLNLRNPYDPISDERTFARLASERAGYRLVELEQDAAFSLEPILQLPPLVSPWLNIFEIGNAAPRAALARECGASAYFRGHGGDQIFFTGAARYMCADFVHRSGVRARLLPIALEAARMQRDTFLSTLRKGVREGLWVDSLATVLGEYVFSPLLRPEATELVRRQRLYVPSCFDDRRHVPPGKCWQVMSLAVGDGMYSVCEGTNAPEIVNPLLSQPLQELCLEIPTHVLAFGGRDRGLARSAFANDLPPEILRRQFKGGVSEYVKAIWVRNLAFVRSLLLDGALVKERIVDRHKLELTLAGDFTKGLGYSAQVSCLIGTEAWLHALRTAPARVAA